MKRVGFLVCCLALTACGGGGSGSQASSVPSGSSPTVVGNTPDINTFPGLSWDTVAPADVDMTQAGIDLALDYAFRRAHNTQGVVIIRHGVIVGERYAGGKTQQSLATSWSTGKSFASALIGIAVEQGFIESIDVPAESYLAPWVNTDKADISIRAILEMRTGLQVAENGDAAIYTSGGIDGDQLAYALNRTPATPPRTANWVYQNTDSMLLAGILEESTGQNVLDYADLQLFSKIGMTADWWVDEQGHAMTYCCIDATTRDFARFGLLFARDGRWLEDQVISAAWVEESTTVPEGTDNPSYALQWWVNQSAGYIYTAGLHKNNIYIFPQYDLVIVRNSSYTKEGSSSIRTGANYHSTMSAVGWDDSTFLSYITGSISD